MGTDHVLGYFGRCHLCLRTWPCAEADEDEDARERALSENERRSQVMEQAQRFSSLGRP